MSNRRYPVITISREFGAGGRSIAKSVSDKLNIPFFDRDFVKQTAKESGYSIEDVELEGESLSRKSKVLNEILNNTASYHSSHDAIYNAQKELVLKLAQEDCILIGRCSNIILQEAGIPSLDIFLYADQEARIAHIKELGLNGDEDPYKCLVRTDSLRDTYYKTYTKHVLGDYHDYDLILNTGIVGYDRCADLIVELAKKYENK
jgi:cytidylate kinase